MNEPTVEIEAPTFEEAVRDAAGRLGVEPGALGLNVIDPGRSAASEGGYRPVKLQAWVRSPSAPPDGAHPGTGRAARAYDDEPRRGYGPARPARHAESYGPPPPPLDPSLITAAHVQQARLFAAGIAETLPFPAQVEAERTTHGIRVTIAAGERDPLLIGPEGETLEAIQYLLSRMMRGRARSESAPRLEVDVAGFRDRKNEELRELARALIEQAQRTGEDAMSDLLPPSERRIVHLEVAQVPGMASLSVGSSVEKRVIVRRADPGEGS
jgi:spoIIIJ-associated protein